MSRIGREHDEDRFDRVDRSTIRTDGKGIMAVTEGLRKQLSDLVTSNRVVLFMKGTRQMPQCEWPTIPQLYVGGQFVGGCDIVREMKSTGALQKLLGAEVSVPPAPSISISAAATKVFEKAVAEAGKDLLRLQSTTSSITSCSSAPGSRGTSKLITTD